MGLSIFVASVSRGNVGLWLGALLLGAGGCSGEGVDADDDLVESVGAVRAPTWESLGGNLNPYSGQAVTALSLAVEPLSQLALAFSASDPATGSDHSLVLRWRRGEWTPLGEALDASGPAIAVDGAGRLHACLAVSGAGPVLQRWNGSAWIALGGDIGIETGFAGTRYSVDGCAGIVFDGPHVPLVAWSADVGAKANSVYAARWDRHETRWGGVGPGAIGGRALFPSLAIDDDHRPSVASFSPGGSYGGGATTRVWRWDGAAWGQLGADMPGTAGPVIAVERDSIFLALHDNASGAINIMRWRNDAWSSLPSPGLGSAPALAFTSSGRLVVAFVDAASPNTIRVEHRARGAWHEVGTGITSVADGSLRKLALGIDDRDRPIVAWTEADTAGNASVFAKRNSAALP